MVKHMDQIDFYQKLTLPNNNDGHLALKIVFFLQYIPFLSQQISRTFSIAFSEK